MGRYYHRQVEPLVAESHGRGVLGAMKDFAKAAHEAGVKAREFNRMLTKVGRTLGFVRDNEGDEYVKRRPR